MTLKVAIVSRRIEPWRGGAETSTLQFVKELARRGVDLHLYTAESAVSVNVQDARVVRIDDTRAVSNHCVFAAGVDRLLSDRRYDLIHAVSPCFSADIYQPRGGTVLETMRRNVALRESIAGQLGKRVINLFNLKKRSLARLERRVLSTPQPPVVIALSDYVASQLRRDYQLPAERIRVIFNGIAINAPSSTERVTWRRKIREMYGIKADDTAVLMIAHNFRLKGVYSWIRALAQLSAQRRRKIRTLVVGKDSIMPFKNLAYSLGVEQSISFVGPTCRIVEFLCAADVLMHPTFYDPCSRVVLESMLLGVPCVTTHFNGASEVIEHGVTGMIVEDPRDVHQLAHAFEAAIQPQVRQALEQRHNALAQRISMARHADDVIALYRELTGIKDSTTNAESHVPPTAVQT